MSVLENPFAAPTSEVLATPKSTSKPREIDFARQRLPWAMLLGIVSLLSLLSPDWGSLIFVTVIFQFYVVMKLTKAMEYHGLVSLLLVLSMLLPVLNVVVLLILSNAANKALSGIDLSAEDTNLSPEQRHLAKLRAVGLAQRRVLWGVLFALTAPVIPFVFFFSLPFLLYCVDDLTAALDIKGADRIMAIAGTLIPLINLIILFSLSRRATKILREAGIPVGFMGAKRYYLPPPV